MILKERIIIRLYFPNFKSPSSSRFESLFFSLSKIDENKDSNYLPYKILPEKIIQGLDKRSSLIIKNIPKYIKKIEIRNMIQQFGNINCLLLTEDEQNENLINAYLNVINYRSIVPIYMALRNHKFIIFNKIIQIEINYSKIQGKEELKKQLSVRNSD